MKYLILIIFLLLIYDVAASTVGSHVNIIDCAHLSEYDANIVSLHDSSQCCWIMINNGVYDVTKISDRFACGEDNTISYSSLHGLHISPLKDFYIGSLSAKATAIVELTIVDIPLHQYSRDETDAFYAQQNIDLMKKVLVWMAKL